MSRLRLATALAVMLLAAGAPAWALDPAKRLGDCPLELWRVRDGLPGGWVRGIVQTGDGYLWIGTFGGLTRFDGQRMIPVVSQDRFRRVADVNGLSIGVGGRLWVIPSFGGPVCIRGFELENCLTEIPPLEPNTRLLSSVRDGDDLYLLGRNELFRYTAGRAHLVIRYADAPWKRINGLSGDGKGRLWLATDTGLWLMSRDPDPGQPMPRIQASSALGIESDGEAQAILRLWSGALLVALPDRLLRIEQAGAGFRAAVEGASHGYPGGDATTLLEDRDGNLWVGTALGLVRRTASRAFDRFGKADGLPDDDITALFEDREGSLWVGMRSGGLAQLTDRSLDTRQGPALLRSQVVQSLTQDRTGAYWFATQSGLLRWKDGETRQLGLADGLRSLRLASVLAATDGALWIGSEVGLQRMVGGKVETILDGNAPVVAMLEDRARRLWIGGEGRVGRIDGGRVQWLPVEAGARWETVRAIEEDDQGTVWVAAIGGLARIDGGRLVRANIVDGRKLPSARSIHRDAQGTLWFGTNGGLLRRKQGRFQQYAAAQGVVAEQIYQVLTDDLGFVWMGTGRGLHRVARSDLEAIDAGRRSQVSPAWFDTSDQRRDVAVTNVRQPGAWRAADGRLWFATDQGVIVVDPKRPHVNTRPPTILIEEALVDGRPARTEADTAAIGAANDFPAGNGNLEFRFALVTMIEPRKAQLRYRLEGFDAGWNDAGPRREARYIRVPPGRYRFRVQGANADGVWNETGAAVELRIAPHFYKTTWFYGLGALGVLTLGWLFYRLRVDRLRRDYLAAFTERSRVARELHDTLLQSMAAVAMHLRGLRRRLEPVSPPASRELETIENMVTLSLEETRRFVWNLREQPLGSGDLGRALGQLAERITAGRAPAAELTVQGEVIPLPSTVQSDLFRIAQEALANAVKHADAKRIQVMLDYQPGRVQLTVLDDGKGFDPATAQGASAGHFGLVGMRERAARMGSFSLDSRPGAGTKVMVTVPVTSRQGAAPASQDDKEVDKEVDREDDREEREAKQR